MGFKIYGHKHCICVHQDDTTLNLTSNIFKNKTKHFEYYIF
jgi:hypothetical protein